MSVDFMRCFATEADVVLAAMLEQNEDCIKLIGLDGSVEYLSRNGCKALHCDDVSMIVGLPWPSLWPEPDRDQVIDAIARAKAGTSVRFEGYCPDFAGNPRWWDVSVSPIRHDGEITHLLATSRDITRSRQERQSERERRERAEKSASHDAVVAREMRHRFKNQLAVVGSLMSMTARHATSAADLAQRMTDKLSALGATQTLLATHHDRPVPADLAVEEIIKLSGAPDRIARGFLAEEPLGEQTIQLLSLTLVELQTNSFKYGALGRDGGTVTVTSHTRVGQLVIDWVEDCGAPCPGPGTEGAGFQLLRRLGSCNGNQAQIAFHERGLATRLFLPLGH